MRKNSTNERVFSINTLFPALIHKTNTYLSLIYVANFFVFEFHFYLQRN